MMEWRKNALSAWRARKRSRARSIGTSAEIWYRLYKEQIRMVRKPRPLRTWTIDLKDRRIRVNAVSPGSIDTPGLSDLQPSSEVGEQQKKLISNTGPFGRFGIPDEIAKAVGLSDPTNHGNRTVRGWRRRTKC